MAWLRRKGDVWHCETTVHGKRVGFSTGTHSRRAAEKIADQRLATMRGEMDANQLMKGVLVSLGADVPPDANAEELLLRTLMFRAEPASVAGLFDARLRAVEEAAKQSPTQSARIRTQRLEFARLIQGTDGARLALADAWTAFLNAPKRREQDDSTLESKYAPAWKRFSEWAAKTSRTYLHEITEADAEGYMAALQAYGFSAATRASHRGVLRALWNVLTRQGGLSGNPWQTVAAPEADATRRQPLSVEELQRLFAVAEGEDRVVLAIGLFTGLRLADICALRWSDVDLKSGIITITPHKTRKHGTHVRVPISPTLHSILHPWQKHSTGTHVLPVYAADHEHHRSFAARRLAEVFARAGIGTEMQQQTGKRRRRASAGLAHRLRHSFVTFAAAAGVPRVAITAITGHKSNAVEAYEHGTLELARQAVNAIPASVIKE